MNGENSYRGFCQTTGPNDSLRYPMNKNWTEIFEAEFALPVSAVAQGVWRQVYGPEYPEGVEPYSYVSRTELLHLATELHLDESAHFVDVGCGRGGPGLWVAVQTGAQVTGIDIAPSALAAAQARARSLGLSKRSNFLLGSFESIPLESDSMEAVMSVDALLFTPDKLAALRSICRVLRPGGRFVFTSWDYRVQPKNRPPQVNDHRPLLEQAGFIIHAYNETDAWFDRVSRTNAGLLAAIDELAAESGIDVATLRTGIAEAHATIECMLRRVFVVAQKL